METQYLKKAVNSNSIQIVYPYCSGDRRSEKHKKHSEEPQRCVQSGSADGHYGPFRGGKVDVDEHSRWIQVSGGGSSKAGILKSAAYFEDFLNCTEPRASWGTSK